MLVNLEDLWLETEPQNMPGTTDGVTPWRRKAALSLGSIRADSALSNLLQELHAACAGA